MIAALLATQNRGKARELQTLLGLALEPVAVDVEEDADSFAGNALLKARAARAHARAGEWGLGDDSGLEVRALDGEPGVRSARWAGPDDAARNRRLLERLDGVDDRAAAFVCALAAVGPGGEELCVEGRLEGSIAGAPAGDAGFGYDPVFVPAGETRTLGQLGQARKDEISHRRRAATALLAALADRGALPARPGP